MGKFFYFILCGVLFSIVLNIIYFSKRHIKTREMRVFSILLVINLISLLSELACSYIGYTSEVDSILPHISTKLYLVCLMSFLLYMTLYIYVICYSSGKNNDIDHYEKLRITSYIIWAVCIVTATFLPITTGKGFATGLSVNWAYACSALVITSWAIPMIKNIKTIDWKKAIPIFLFVLCMLAVSVVQKSNPEITIMTVMEFMIIFVMYHTIENPDIKMLNDMIIAKDQAEKANLAKSDFLSSMSHEIRTPLNAIVGLSEDMKEKDECPESMKEDLEDVVSASRTLLEIVGNIMDISKIESDKMEIIEVPYNFKEEIETLARINAVRIGDKQLELKVNIAEDIPYELVGDRGHVKEIVNNLLSNAIKYTDKGTVNLTVKCINENDICNLMISVEDTGRGIKKENIEKLFTKFERLDVERNTTTEGTGLGLAITKKLVELMGGKINVESEFGKGSIFIVHIPQRIGSMTRPITDTQLINTSEIVKESRKKRVNYKTKSILIVDDNKLNIKVARRSLEQLNFKVIDECYNGKECVDKIKNNEKYDIILMDIMMPIMSGETALEELKKIDGFNTPVIALTADAVAGAEERYEKEGFTSYISKPFNKDQIKVKLDSIFKEPKKEKEFEEDIWKDAPTYVFTSSLSKENDISEDLK